MSVIKPSNNPIPFGQSGLVNPIPATTATAGKASFDLGFPPITMVQKSLGGLAPDGKDLNGILNHIDQHTVWQTAGGRYYYDSALATAVGGYAVGAVVQADDNTKSYVNTLAGNTSNPNTGGANWQVWSDRGLRADLASTVIPGASLVGYGTTTVKAQLDANQAAIAGNTTAIAGNTAAISAGTTVAAATLTALNAITGKPANTLGYVTNDGTTANNGMYQWNGTVWTKSTYDPTARLAIVESAFTLTPSKNIFVQGLAVDGKYRGYPDGLPVVYSQGMDFGLQPVTAGQTYTWSLPSGLNSFNTVILCYTSSGTYLGTATTVGSNPVAPIPPTGIFYSNTNHTVTFTIPSGSTIGKIAINGTLVTHTSADFNTCVNSLQIEVGSSATSYVSPAPIEVLHDNSLPSTVARLTDVSASLLPITSSFSVVKNLFNPALAVDGVIINYASGVTGAYANGMSFGKQPVQAGKTYTWWMPTGSVGFIQNLYSYNAAGAFLGNDHVIGSNPVAPTPPTGIVYSNGGCAVTFTIPVGSGIAYVGTTAAYSTHTTAQFNALVASMQLEIGSVPSAFVSGQVQSLNDASLPATAARLSDIQSTSSNPLALTARFSSTTVSLDGTYAYVRTAWSSTLDLVQQVQYGSTTAVSNNVVTPYASKTIPNTTAKVDTITAFGSGTLIHSSGDDASPCGYNGTYIGANHGANFIHQVTVTGHDKTVQDVGSQWTASGLTWTIMKIVDANTLWLLSQNTGGATWNFNTSSLNGVALTHSSGATHTGSFTPSADALTQMLPAIRNQIKTILLDGRTTVTANGFYPCEFVDIVNSYDICNPVGVLSYVQSLVGSATQPSFTDSSIVSDMRVNNTYRYASNGSVSINAQYQSKSALQWNWVGGTQALPINYGANTLLQYIPKLLPIVGGTKTWDFTAIEDVTSTTDTIFLVKANWADANNPPSRMAQIVKVGATKTIGHVVGYGLQRGYSVPATRKSNLSAGFFNAPTRKMYPYLVDSGAYPSGLMPANTVVNSIVYRSLFNPANLPTATVFTWYYDGDDIVVVFDIHSSVTAFQLPLPSWFQGKSATVIDASASFSLLTPIVTNDGLLVTVTGGYGQASIKLR